ncbi:MAG: tight adherence protein [Microbacteriaceae bacterium]|jgi:tight adherence protein B|nr:tight adherence protein [Microbacteriaceae bacterium]MDQ1608351.1 tight adherence protein [Microbacteriaceae bacterium]
MNAVVLYSGIALGVVALLVIVFLVIAPPAPRVAIERRRAPGAVQVSTLSRVTNVTVGAIDGVIAKRGSRLFGAAELEQANVKLNPPSFILMVVCAAVVFGGSGLLLGNGTIWAIPLMLVFGALAPVGAKVLLALRAGRRRARFADQLDDSLTLLSGGLRAGHSLLRAIDAVSRDADSPSAEEFARVVNETRVGRDLGDSLDGIAVRMHSEDFQWVSQAIAINREVGGNLAEVFDQVGHTIRERNQIRRQVKALSAEGKMSAYVLLLLPIGVFAFLLLTQPSYFAAFFTSIWGFVAIGVASVLMVVGSLWMMAAVKVKF